MLLACHRRRAISILAWLWIASLPASIPSSAAVLEVTVVDSRDRHPIPGAFVMVGPAPGNPFPGNSGTTSASGSIVFDDGAIAGPQTVTAGAASYAYTALIESVEGSVELPLYPALSDTVIYGPKARVTGTVYNIETVNNDGNFDAAMILPAISPDNVVLGVGGVPFEVPPDVANFPIYGEVAFPGNVVLPSQVELLFFTFAKTQYKIDLPAQTTQTLYSVSARIPIDALLNGVGDDPLQLLKIAQIRELGVERDRPIGDGGNVNINSDHNLRTELTVRVEEAPAGAAVQTVSAGSLEAPSGAEQLLLYDTDSALSDTLGDFLMTSSVPAGDISDVRNLVFGAWMDSSAALSLLSARVDRGPFTLPATRVLRDFYDPPVLDQEGFHFGWSEVADPGTEPEPTWSAAGITLAALDPADTTVVPQLLWRVVTPAGRMGFDLPILPPEAPGAPHGLIDPSTTPDADRLVWDVLLSNSAGSLDEVLVHPSTGVTHVSRRLAEVALPAATLEDASPPGPASLAVRPNPAGGPVIRIQLRGATAPSPFGPFALEIFDLRGRRVRSLPLAAGAAEAEWDGRDDAGRRLPPGTYFLRIDGIETGGKVQLLP
ncbi:MAG: FlgD immunoglobulin-like domain containing protein [Candidatus Eisenbacteria bacterium]|nr:FlgD immunoglobulin-like domain containing protein [Candidatus Eisenbacteria bacterium]